jgi:hypothetical protein
MVTVGEDLYAGQELGPGQEAGQDADWHEEIHGGHGRLLDWDGIHTR